MSFKKENRNGAIYYFCSELRDAGFENMFTTKSGGVSFGRNEMNFGTSCGDTDENIMANYKKALSVLGTVPEKTVKSKQTHSNIVLNVDETFGGEGIIREQRFFEADGLITEVSDLTLLVFYADCVPVLIADKETKTICAVHSGWRGTKANIVKIAIDKMVSQHNCNPKNIIAAIGPAIGICHFEVQENIYNEFKELYGTEFTEVKDGKFYIDLAKTVKNQLITSEVPEENVILSDICTYCNKDLYSYRREGNEAGRMAAFIKTPEK